MLLNLPDKVLIGYRDVKITGETTQMSSKGQGEYFADKNEIVVNLTQDSQELPNTVLHEILHAVWHINRLDEVVKSCNADNVEELMVSNLANSITALFRLNPHFANWFHNEMTAQRMGVPVTHESN
jgi:Zn-dependent peptidase ImmA (M78 family)